jgi:quinol monooxygenase YgiN
MFGLIGRITAHPGQRDALIAVLTQAGSMPGCLSYVVARDNARPDALYVTEVWESAEAHAASLNIPEVREAIGRGRPLIAGFETIAKTEVVGGIGLPRG